MAFMFYVRVPPSRVLPLLGRCVAVITHPPSRRSRIAAHSTRPPVPRCAVGSLGLQSAHRWMERELGDEHVSDVRCTYSSITRVDAAIASTYRRIVVLARPLSPVPCPLAPRSPLTRHGRPSLAALQQAYDFNQPIGDWDVIRAATGLEYMFYVRTPASRVLLLLRRCVVAVSSLCRRCVVAVSSLCRRCVVAVSSLCRRCVVAGRRPRPSLRDRRSLHTAARPSLPCSKPTTSTRTSARGASNRFRPSPLSLTTGLHSQGLRRTSRNGG